MLFKGKEILKGFGHVVYGERKAQGLWTYCIRGKKSSRALDILYKGKEKLKEFGLIV